MGCTYRLYIAFINLLCPFTLHLYQTYACLPFDPLIVGGISTILLLVLWSDTTPGDVLSRADRAATRNFISNCLGVSYLLIFIVSECSSPVTHAASSELSTININVISHAYSQLCITQRIITFLMSAQRKPVVLITGASK